MAQFPENHDLFDWVQLAVTTVIAVFAAWLGAKVGGEMARQAALEVHQKEVQANREAREAERNAERDERRTRLMHRMEYILARLVELSESVARQEERAPISVTTLQTVLRVCDRYDEAMNDSILLKRPSFGDEVRKWLEGVVTTAQVALDNEQARVAREQGMKPGELEQSNATRVKSWGTIRDWTNRSKSLLDDLKNQ